MDFQILGLDVQIKYLDVKSRVGGSNPGCGHQNSRFAWPHLGCGGPNPAFGHPILGFGPPNPGLDIQIMDVDDQFLDLKFHIQDLESKPWIWRARFGIPNPGLGNPSPCFEN